MRSTMTADGQLTNMFEARSPLICHALVLWPICHALVLWLICHDLLF